jgi:hypothetical protein
MRTSGARSFWKGVALAQQARECEARAALAEVYRHDPNWTELLGRLPVIDPALADPQLIERLAALPTPSAESRDPRAGESRSLPSLNAHALSQGISVESRWGHDRRR